jgi:hypothetical protein
MIDRLKRTRHRVLRRWRYRHVREWVVGPPDFVGVGTQRSGTTWWWRLLCDHPRVHEPAGGKEIHFFDKYFARDFSEDDVRAYHRIFARPKGTISGEWCPRYMHDFWTPALLRRAAPQAKLLVLLRDPVRRYQSGLSHELDVVQRDVRSKRRGYVGAMDANDALSRSLYGRQLRRLFEHFDRAQVLVLQYEQCVQDPRAALRRTYEFVGVDAPQHVPTFLSDRAGQSHPQIETLDEVTEAARRIIRSDLAELKTLVPEIDLDLWPSSRAVG